MFLLALASPSFAATLVVSSAGPFTTIGAAITTASSGDTITVAAGTWTECLDTAGKNLTIVGAGMATTILTAGATCANEIAVDNGESVTLSDLTVTHPSYRALYVVSSTLTLDTVKVTASGSTSYSGAGAYVSGGTLTATDSIFSSNTGYYGGAIYALGNSAVSLNNTELTANWAYYGAGVFLHASGGTPSLDLDTATFDANIAYYNGAGIYADTAVVITSVGSTFSDNRGYYSHGVGVFLYTYASYSGDGDTFDGNYAYYYTSGYYGGAIYGSTGATITLADSTLTSNVAYGGGAIYGTAIDALTVTGGEISDNTSYVSGGGVLVSGADDVSFDGTLFDANNAYYGYGGAAYVYYYTPLELADCSFASNHSYYSGGAIYATTLYDTATISGTTFDSNTNSYGYGGALHLTTASDAVISDSTFSDNASYYDGGAVYSAYYGAVSVADSSLTGNSTTYGSGGALYHYPVTSGTDDLSVTDSTIEDNTAGYGGGGLYALYSDDVTLSGNRIVDNTAGATTYSGGGALTYQVDSLTVSGNLFCQNTALYGGAFYSYYTTSATQSWSNNVFVENVANHSGGAIYSQSNAYADVINNTFVGNQANYYGGALYAYYTYASVVNNIFAYQLDGDGVYAADSYSNTYSDFTYNDWYANTTTDRSGSFTFSTSSAGNITTAPGFTSYGADGDCDNDDFTLAGGSGNIDAGYPAYLDPDGSASDIGAYGGVGASAWDADGDGYFTGTDCDDDDASVYPGATEHCDGVDEDCNGTVDDSAVDEATWYVDADGDGYGDASVTTTACDEPAGYVANTDDCDDTSSDINPSAAEIAYNGIDEDCDGADLTDVDGDGYDAAVVGGTDCDDADATVYPGAAEIWYDGIDQDCDGLSDYDADGDGHDDEAYGGDDCDDTDATVYPGASDTWYDGVDSDCDGMSDYDADYDGYDSSDYGGDDCNDADIVTHPGAAEAVGDGVDTDCDGAEICSIDADDDGYRPDSTSTVASADPDCDDAGEALATEPDGDCNDADPRYHPGAPEADCEDPEDYNCDGSGGAADADADGYLACTDCNDADAAVNPGATEGVDDGVDQDCDGAELCFLDADADGHRPDATSTAASADLDCDDAGEAHLAQPTDDCDDSRADVYPGADDVPEDGIDQDCNGHDATGDTGGDTGGDTAEPDDTGDSGQGDNGEVELPPEKIKLAGGCDCSTPGDGAAPIAVALGGLLTLRRRRFSAGEPRR